MYSGIFSPLNDDEYAPLDPKLSHQHIDNYGIYSIACIDYEKTIDATRWRYAKANNIITIANTTQLEIKLAASDSNLPNVDQSKMEQLQDFLAYQVCDVNQIPVDFGSLINICMPSDIRYLVTLIE